MADVVVRFSAISHQTETLQADAHQMVAAMRTIRAIAEQSVQHAATISNDPVNSPW